MLSKIFYELSSQSQYYIINFDSALATKEVLHYKIYQPIAKIKIMSLFFNKHLLYFLYLQCYYQIKINLVQTGIRGMMDKSRDQMEVDKWHGFFAKDCNNRTWDLISKANRSEEDNQLMLYLAYASAYHWKEIGTSLNEARAWINLAHVNSLLGYPQIALKYAGNALAFFEKGQGEDWDLAFAFSEMAFACAVHGDPETHKKYYSKANKAGNKIKDNEDRKAFFEEFNKIPKPTN